MINAAELRIGNYFKLQNGHFQQVDLLTLEYLLNENLSPHNAVNPIYITPEILEKCGFKWLTIDRFRFLKHTIKNIQFLFTEKKLMVGVKGVANIEWFCELNYLHQLQNLYYSLTNEELIYKP
jgi:hypothetical protein